MSRFRIAVLGLNHYHVTGWLESLHALSDELDIVAVYDPDPDRRNCPGPDYADPSLNQTFPEWVSDVPFESDLDRLIEVHKPDIALVTLPNVLASAAIKKCAQAGIHILTDKPSGLTSIDVAGAFDVVRQAGVKSSVALTRRYSPGWRDAAEIVRSGRLGRLISTQAVFVSSSVLVRDPSNHIFNREQMGGGVLHWLGIHELDALLWMSGEDITDVQAMTGATGGQAIDVEDVVSASVKYASGALGTIHFAYALPRSAGEGYVALYGTEGALRVSPDGSWTLTGKGTVRDPLYSQTSTYVLGPSSGYGAVGTVIIDDLLRAIHENRDPLAGGDDVARALAVVDAMYVSASTGLLTPVKYVR